MESQAIQGKWLKTVIVNIMLHKGHNVKGGKSLNVLRELLQGMNVVEFVSIQPQEGGELWCLIFAL